MNKQLYVAKCKALIGKFLKMPVEDYERELAVIIGKLKSFYDKIDDMAFNEYADISLLAEHSMLMTRAWLLSVNTEDGDMYEDITFQLDYIYDFMSDEIF